MKNKIQILGLIFAFSLAFTSCEKDNDLNPQENSLISSEGESKERGITNKSAYPITLNIDLNSEAEFLGAIDNLQAGEILVARLYSDDSQLTFVTNQMPSGFGPGTPNNPQNPSMTVCSPLTLGCKIRLRAQQFYHKLNGHPCWATIIDPDNDIGFGGPCD